MFTPPSNQVVGSTSGVPVAAQAVPAGTQQSNLNNPFLDPTNLAAAYQIPTAAVPPQNAMTNGAVHSVASSNPLYVAQQLHISTQPSADDLECFIPGCGKPVHVDAKGMKTSDYCSMRHRECVVFFFLLLCYLFKFHYNSFFFFRREAVASGLVSPCIMCLVLPQNETDYFCSRTCREESMNKDKEWDCSE